MTDRTVAPETFVLERVYPVPPSRVFNAYADQPPMTLVALVGSNDCLEIAIVDDSAAIMLGVGVGAPVEVRW